MRETVGWLTSAEVVAGSMVGASVGVEGELACEGDRLVKVLCEA